MSEVQKILLTFERNAVDAWKDNKSDVAIVRKLRPNRTDAEQALYDLLMEKMPKKEIPSGGKKKFDETSPFDAYGSGYNQALDEMVSAINELFGRTE